MAYMTENTNLQRALLWTIAEAGKGKVEIREHSKVQEMKMDEGKRSVALKIGEHSWVRGGVVVSCICLITGLGFTYLTRCSTLSRLVPMVPIRPFDHSPISIHSVTPTLPMALSRH